MNTSLPASTRVRIEHALGAGPLAVDDGWRLLKRVDELELELRDERAGRRAARQEAAGLRKNRNDLLKRLDTLRAERDRLAVDRARLLVGPSAGEEVALTALESALHQRDEAERSSRRSRVYDRALLGVARKVVASWRELVRAWNKPDPIVQQGAMEVAMRTVRELEERYASQLHAIEERGKNSS